MAHPHRNGAGHLPPIRVADPQVPADTHPDRPPADDIERAILGAILLDPQVITPVSALLDARAFVRPAHRVIFAACAALWARERKYDLVSLSEELNREGKLVEVGGSSYLADLLDGVATAVNAELHARILAEQATLRRIRQIGLDIANRADGGREDPLTLLADMERTARALGRAQPGTGNPLLQGEGSVEELLVTEFPPEPAWVEKLIYPGGASFIVGPPGIGKTTLAFHLIVSLASGAPFFGLATNRCNVGLLALETPGLYAKRKMERILGGPHPPEWAKRVFIRGRGFPPGFPSRWDLLDPKARAQIIEWLLAKQIQVLVLDPFVHFHTEEENDNGDMNRVMVACDDIKDQTGVALAFLHHPGKGESGAGQKGRGSSVPYGYADVELTMMRTKDSRIKVEWTKPPRNDPAPPPFYLLMTPEGLLELAEPEAATNACEAEDLPAKKATVVSTLRAFGQPMKLGDLREALLGQEIAVPASTLHRWLGQLETAGSVRAEGDGTYEAL